MDVYLQTKFEVCSIILTSFRQGGGNFTPPPSLPPQNEPLNSPPRLGLNAYFWNANDSIVTQVMVSITSGVFS